MRPINRLEHAEVFLLQRNAEGLHVKPIAGQHAFLVAPGGIGRRPAAAHIGAINDVVVNQGCRVDHLHYRAQAYRSGTGVTQQVRGQQQQRWANALAAALAQVLGNFRDGAYA